MGKTLLITGAGGAIGAATARLFHQQGARIVLADRNVAGIDTLRMELDASGGTVASVPYDATAVQDASQVVHETFRLFGRLDFLVPGAGIYPESEFDSIVAEDWDDTLRINLSSVFQLCRAAAHRMSDEGAIVTIASIAGHRGSARHAHYAASKGGVLAFTRSIALELAPRIRVNAVSPGVIDTPMVTSLLKVRGASVLADTPLKRFGRPEEVATAIAFLCSQGAAFITGETLHVNGGLYMAS